jgi:hypothetical protein
MRCGECDRECPNPYRDDAGLCYCPCCWEILCARLWHTMLEEARHDQEEAPLDGRVGGPRGLADRPSTWRRKIAPE